MKHYIFSGFPRSASGGVKCISALLFLVFACSAQATAPRIAPQLFGEEKKADIVGYQTASSETSVRSESELTVEIVKEAFGASAKTPVVDMLPSKQLAKYALVNNDAVALIGSQRDLTAQEMNQYRVVTFYLRGVASNQAPVSLIFSKNVRGNELHQAFNEGLQKIIKNGKYLEILEKYQGKGQVPADYARRLKRQNPGWK